MYIKHYHYISIYMLDRNNYCIFIEHWQCKSKTKLMNIITRKPQLVQTWVSINRPVLCMWCVWYATLEHSVAIMNFWEGD